MHTVENCVWSKLLFWLRNKIQEPLSNQILTMEVSESLKTTFYLSHYASLLKKANVKTDHVQFSKLCLLESIILVKKNNIFEFLTIQIFTMKVHESIKTIFNLFSHFCLFSIHFLSMFYQLFLMKTSKRTNVCTSS